MIQLFANQGGTSANSTAINWPGGYGTFAAWGTFKGGTIVLKAAFNSTTYISMGLDVTHTAADMGNFVIGPCTLRAEITGSSSAATSITAVIA